MNIQFLGAAKTVTGSCYLLDTGKNKILIDCGLYQGEADLETRNKLPFSFNPREIDYVLLTHAHLDHSGLLPKLVKDGFEGEIIATEPTIELVDIMLMDSAKVQLENLKKELFGAKEGLTRNFNRKDINHVDAKDLLYSVTDVEKTMRLFRAVVFERVIPIGDGISVEFLGAGHILGAAILRVLVDDKIIVFSGDIGHEGQYLMKNPTIVDSADFALLESTYGTRIHPSKKDTEEEFFSIIEKTISRGGNVIIPSFAVERTQELLYAFHLRATEHGFNYPVYLDSPMALRATEVFARSIKYFNEETNTFYNGGGDMFAFDSLYLISDIKDSFSLKRRRGNIIIAGSGMCTGGRVLYHLQNNLEDPNSTVLFVGFQAKGTLGREILDGNPYVVINSKKVNVHSEIYNLTGFSAHADKNDLFKWLDGFSKERLKTIFVVHGEEVVQQEFASEIRRNYKIDVVVPDWKQKFEL